ncbi:unnamed protein product [Mytilus coruscus]|uniref:Integrin beta-like protein A-E N-terminal domain-containing protein n=1 Tax=Mytilus coruscus TaxID=42192 RepID=A0A6J8EY82_MYTCO|nr:unnamed protein product [Mytilus coruscus]
MIHVLYFQLVESSHFRGGFISWKPTENNQIEINYRVAFRRSASSHMCDETTIDNGTINSGEGTLQCLKGCIGSITTMSYYCTDFSDTEEWTTGTNSIKYNPSAASSDNLYHFGFTGCCWINLVEGGSNWMMRTTADLNKRKDTGKINSSPISAMQPIVRFNYGCDYTLKIPVSDDDGDVVRCRWSTKTPNDECSGVCETLSGAYLEEQLIIWVNPPIRHATLVVDDHVVKQVTDNPESDAVIVLNPSCSAFKTPEKVRTKCTEAVAAVPPLFYLESSCPSHFVQCNELGIGYIMPCAPGTEWCQQKLTCVHLGSCKT